MKTKVLLSLLFLFFAPVKAWGANSVYISQNGAGAQDGLACSSAKPVSYFNASGNWSATPTGVQIGPATTIHICGTFTGTANSTMFTFQGNGTSGNVITLFAESGANLTAPYWALTGAINVNGKSFIVLDGNNTGTIQNTANGTGLAFAAGSYGIYSSGGHDVTVQNWTIANICLKQTGAAAGCSTSNVQADAIFMNGGNNLVVNHNTIHDAHWLVFMGFPTSVTTTGMVVSNNTLYNGDHMVAIGDSNPGGTLNGLKIFGNDMHDMVNWDGSSGFHHDYIHIFTGFNGGATTITGGQIYNNYFHGDPGQTLTAFVNMENNTGNTFSNFGVYNNFMTNSSTTHLPPYGYFSSGGSSHSFLNNTIIGGSTNGAPCFYAGGINYTFKNNTCSTTQYGIVWGNSGSGTISLSAADYNNWFNTGSWVYSGTFNGFSAWKTACSCDSHSIQVTPNVQTISPFTPNAGSGLIATGTNLGGLGITALNSDITGAPPSGAFGNGTARPGGVTPWDIGAGQSVTLSVPGVPGSLTASVSSSTVNLTWSASTGTVTGYTVKRGTTSGGPYTQVATNITTTSYADTNLSAGTYYYVVSAFNSAGSSANSSQASATVQPQVTVPSAPATLAASASGSSVTLTWTASLGTPTNYIVKRGTVNGGPYTTIATLGLVTSYVDSGLANGTYYYVVAASNSAGSSPNSPQAQITVSTSAALTLFPSAAQSFGSVVIGQTATSCGTGTCVISVNSTGTANLILAGSNAVTLSGANAADFSISATTCTNGLTIVPGNSCTVTLTFTPSTSGLEIASLVIVSNEPTSPDTVSLSGTGVLPLVISPTSINFGNVFTNKTSSTQTVTVTNNSGVTVTFSSIALTTGTQFNIVSNTCGGSVANSASCTIGLTFAPTSVATFNDTLTFTDSASTSPQTVSLTGRGKRHGVLKIGAAVKWPGGANRIYTVLRPWKPEELLQRI